MFCGTGSFKNIDSDPWIPSSPKKKAIKNPYSARGLDKFSTLLNELEARRAKIMAKAGSQGIQAMVRFTYSNSDDWIPIIVKLPSDTEKPKRLPPPPPQPDLEVVREASPAEKDDIGEGMDQAKLKKSFAWCVKEGKGWSWKNWRPAGYCWALVMVMVLMLLCLVMFGRVFAICCTAVGWYMVPLIQEESSGGVRRSMKKKDYGRRLSPLQAKKVRGAQEASSPRGHGGNGKIRG